MVDGFCAEYSSAPALKRPVTTLLNHFAPYHDDWNKSPPWSPFHRRQTSSHRFSAHDVHQDNIRATSRAGCERPLAVLTASVVYNSSAREARGRSSDSFSF